MQPKLMWKQKAQQLRLFMLIAPWLWRRLRRRQNVEPDWTAFPKLLSLRATARLLGVHVNTLRLWDQRGWLRSVRIGSRQDRRYERERVQAVWRQSHASRQEVFIQRWVERREAFMAWRRRSWRPFGASALGLSMLWGMSVLQYARADQPHVPQQSIAPATCLGWRDARQALSIDRLSNEQAWAEKSATYDSDEQAVTSSTGTASGSLDTPAPTITCSSFTSGLPSSATLTSARIRAVLRTSGPANSTDAFQVEYMLDGRTWVTGDTVPAHQEGMTPVSFDLPTPTRDALSRLQVRITPELELGTTGVRAALDGIVVDVRYTVPIDESSPITKKTKQQLDPLVQFSQSMYEPNEQPVVTLPKRQVKKLFYFFTVGKTDWNLDAVELQDSAESDFTPQYTTHDITDRGSTVTKLNLTTTFLHPGKYTVRVHMSNDAGGAAIVERTFLWGVVALNFVRPTPAVGEQEIVALGILDDGGRTICDADVTAKLTDPRGRVTTYTTTKGSIVRSAVCVDKGVTNTPDYSFSFTPNVAGAYNIALTAKTKFGVRTLKENILVSARQEFDVQRSDYPTRIYPPADYNVTVSITPHRDFRGVVTEWVPGDFAISKVVPLGSLAPASDAKKPRRIDWAVEWKAGETYQLHYTFKAPDISPALFLTGPLTIAANALQGSVYTEPRQWQIASDSIATGSGYVPSSGTLATGNAANRLAATAASGAGVNTGSYLGTLADDNYHWTASGINTASVTNIDMQLNVDGVQLNGANKIIIQTEIDTDAAIAALVQICDWDDASSAGNFDSAEDSNCNDGSVDSSGAGWRTLNSQSITNTDIAISTITSGAAFSWNIRDGYFTTGSTGGTALSTPLANFVKSGTNQVKIRYYSATQTSTAIDIDYLRVIPIIDSVYEASGFTQITGGTPSGTYVNTNVFTNTSAAMNNFTSSDAVYLAVPGTGSAISDFYLSYKNVQTYTGANTIYVRADYSCSTTGINIKPKIYNFNTTAWQDLTTGTIACSGTDANGAWAMNNVTISNYISNGEIRVGWYGSGNNTLSIRLDFQYIMIGTTNSDSAQCEITFGTGTATNCTNTRDIDLTGTTNNFSNPAEDESNTFGKDFYALDNDGDATVEEAAASNINFSVTAPSGSKIVNTHYAGRFDAGSPNTTTALTVGMGLRDYTGIPTSTSGNGGWTRVGATDAAQASGNTYTLTDSVTAWTAALYGYMDNPEDRVDTTNNLMNVRLQTTASGTTTNNVTVVWDFAMVSIAWINTTEHPSTRHQFTPTGGATVTAGTNPARLAATANTVQGVNTAQGTAGWKGTLANDNYHWSVAGAGASGVNFYLDTNYVQLNGANKIIIQTEFDLDTTLPSPMIQICDWDDQSSAGNFDSAEDTQCNDGVVDGSGAGWRSLNSVNASNAEIIFSNATPAAFLQWQIYDGYWSTGTAGGTSLSTPLTNFIDTGASNKIRIRWYATTNHSSNTDVDYLSIMPIVDSMYEPAAFTQISGGTPTGTYASSRIMGNTASAQQSTATTSSAGDGVYLSVPGTVGTISDFYFSFKNIKLYNGMNTIYVRSEYSCSTTGVNIKPKIYNFKTGAWVDLTSATIACAAGDAMGTWAVNNVTITDYIQNGELRVGWYGSAANTLSIRIDDIFIILGSTNSDTAQCAITFGTGTATDCVNTRTIDLNSTVSSFGVTAADETNTFGNDFNAQDNDGDANLEEANSSNIGMTVGLPSNASPVGGHFAGRFAAGYPNTGAGNVNQLGMRNYAGVPTSTAGVGGWDAIGATATAGASAPDAYTHTDSLSVLAANVYGTLNNPNMQVDLANDLMDLRLRTTTGGASGNNVVAQWDFAFVSVMWTETTGVTVSGNVYSNETPTFTDCTTPKTVRLKINGSGNYSGSCTGASGSYTISNVAIPYAGATVTVYLDGATEKGSVTTISADGTSSISNLHLYENTVVVTHENAGPVTNDNLRLFDSGGDSDVQYTVAGAAAGPAVTVASGDEFHVPAGDTFTAGGQLTTNATGGKFHVLGTATLDAGSNNVIGTDIDVGTAGTLNINASTTVTGGDITTTGNATVTTTAGTPNVSLSSTGSIGGGTNALTFYALLLNSGTTTTTSDIVTNNTVNVAVSATLAGSTNMTIKGNFWGQGTVARTGGTVTQRIDVNRGFASTAGGTNDWTFNNLTFSNSDPSNARTISVQAGTGQVVVNGTLQIGDSGDAQNTTFDNETANDRILNANGAVNITSKGVLLASSTQAFTVAGDWTNSGTFTANSGTVTFDGTSQQAVSGTLTGASGRFNTLVVTNAFGDASTTWSVTFAGSAETTATFTATTADTKLRFNAGSTYTFQNIDFNGQATGTRVYLRSSSNGSAWNLAVAGTRSVSYTNVRDSDATASGTAIDASNGTNIDGTGNTNWNFSSGISISGFIYTDDATTPLDCSTGGSRTVAVKVNGSGTQTGTCSLNTGAYSISSVTVAAAGDVLTVFISGASEKAATVTLAANNSSNITGLPLRVNRLVVTHESAGPMTNSATTGLGRYDDDDDATNLFFTANSNNLTLDAGKKLLINSGKTYTPGGTVTTPAAGTAGNVDSDIEVQSSGVLSMGTNALSIGGDFTNAGTLTLSSGQTTTMTATGTGFTLTSGGQSLRNLTFNGSGGGWTNGGALTLAENFTGTSGGFTQANSTTITVNGTSFSLANGFTWTKASSGANLILENVSGLAFADNNTTKQNLGAVQIGASPGTTTLTTDMSADSVTIPTGDTFNTKGYDVTTTGSLDCQGTCALNLTDTAPNNEGDGTVMTIGGDWTTSSTSTFTAATSTVIMNGTGSKTISNAGGAFNHLQTNNTGTYTIGGGITDDFERAAPLGSNWTGRVGTPTISGSSDYGGSASADNIAAYTGATFSNDQFAEGTISAMSSGNEVQVCVRMNDTGSITMYCLAGDGTFLDIIELTSGGWGGVMASSSVFAAVGDRVRLEVQGTTFRGYINGRLVVTGSDSTTASGYPGLNVWAGGTPTSTIEDFTAGSLLQTSGDITVTQGTLALGAGSAYVGGGDVSVSGTLSQSSNGVTSMMATGSVAGSGTTTFGSLVTGTSSSTITTTAGGNFSATMIDIPASSATNTFDASSRTVTISGSGSPLVVDATEVFTASSSTVVFTGAAATTVPRLTYNNLQVKPGANSITHTLAGGGTLTINGTFEVGNGSNTGVVIDANTEDPTITVASTMTINGNTTFQASSANGLTVGGNVTNSGTYTHNNGTATLNGTTSTTLNSGCANTDTCTNGYFYNLIINKTDAADANDNVTLTSNGVRVANTLTITDGELIQGALNVRAEGATAVSIAAAGKWTNIVDGDLKLGGGFSNAGTATFNTNNNAQCTNVADDILITSTSGGTQRLWNGGGTFVIRNVNATDMTDSSITAYTSTLSNTTWSVGGCGITVSGTVYQTSSESTGYGCNADNLTVYVAVNGDATPDSGTCTAADGTFSISNVTDPGGADVPIAVYIDTGESVKATTVTLSSAGGANISGLSVMLDRLVVTQQSATALTNSHLSTADNGNAGIRYSVSVGALTVESGMELHVLSGKTFTPGGTVTTTATGTAAGAAGDVHIAGTLTMGTNALNVGGDYTNAGTFNKTNTQTTTLTATSTGFTITPGTGAMNNLTVSGDAGGNGTYTLSGADLTVDGVLTVNTGDTLTIDTSRTLTNSGSTDVNNDGTINGAGTLTFNNATSGGPDSDANSTGVYSATVRYDATANNIPAAVFDARTYSGKVELYSNSTSARTITMGSGTHTLSGASSHLHVIAANTADLTIAGDTNNPTVTIGGNLDFTGTGNGYEVLAAGTGTWTVTGNVDFTNGVYGPAVTALAPIAANTAQLDDFVDPLATCGPPTSTYSCLGSGTVQYGVTTIGDCINNNENQHTYRNRGYLEYNPTGIGDTATILTARIGATVTDTYTSALSVARSTTDDIESLGCTTSGGRYGALNNSTYGTVNLSSAGNVMVPLGATGAADVQSRITGTTARLTIGLQTSSTESTMGAISAVVSGAPYMYVGYIDGGSPTLTMNGTSKTLTTAGNGLYNLNIAGTITLANETHYIGGDLNLTGGDVTPGSSTVYLTGAGKTLTAPASGDTLNTLTIDPASVGTVTVAAGGGDLTVGSFLTVATGDTLSLGSGRTLTLSAASGSSLALLGTISGSGRLTYMTSTAFPTTGTISSILRFDATSASSQTISSRTYGGAVEVYNNSGGAKTVASNTGTMAFSSTLDLSVGSGSVTLDLNTTDPTTTTVSGALTIGANSTLSAPSTNGININGNYTNNGTFTDNAGTVTLAGAAQQTLSGTMTGASDFNNLVVTNASGSNPDSSPSVIFNAADAAVAGTFTATTANTKIRFDASNTYTFVNVTINGQATGTRVYLRSSTNGTQWNLTSTGTQTVSNTDVRDSNACGGDTIDAIDGTNNDATNNSCWNINTISLTISDTTIGFGACSAGGARYATGDTLGASSDSTDAHTLSVATNARSGYSLTVAGSTLTATVGTITAIGGTAQSSSVGSEQFGLRAIKNSGTGTVSSPFDTANWAFTAGTTQSVASYTGASSSYSAVYGVRYICNVSGITEAGNYATDMTYILTSTF